MAYQKQYFIDGEVLKADQLNNMVNGISDTIDEVDVLGKDVAGKAEKTYVSQKTEELQSAIDKLAGDTQTLGKETEDLAAVIQDVKDNYVPKGGADLNGALGTQDVYPVGDSDYSLGKSNRKYKEVHANAFYQGGTPLDDKFATKADVEGLIDATLTSETKAAQAKAVGDALNLKLDRKDVVNTLTSTDATKPLSAAQGKALKALIDNINTSGGGGGSTSVSLLSHDSTGTEFNDAVRDYQYYKTPIMFLDDVDSCPMVTFTSSENTAPICYFLNGRTKQILEVLNGGYKVRVYITDLKYTVRAVFTEEEMDAVLDNAKDDNEGEVYQYIGGGGKYAMGSIYMVTKE